MISTLIMAIQSIAFRTAFSITPLLVVVGCIQPAQPLGLYEVRSMEDVEFIRRGDTPLKMDIYVPGNASIPHPGIVLFHGGGWLMGDRTEMRSMARYLASIGYTAATADYRLSDKGGQFPAAVADAYAAVSFLLKGAKDYDIDPNRMGVIGYSAGAQLAMLVGLVKDTKAFGESSDSKVVDSIKAIVDISGPTDLSKLEGSDWVILYMVEQYMGGKLAERSNVYAQASPITHVRHDGPPILIMHGERDDVVSFQQAIWFSDALKLVGSPSLLVSIPGEKHDWNFPFGKPMSLRALPLVTQFLTRYLDGCSTTRPAD